MCLAVPLKIVKIIENTGVVEAGGVTKEVSLHLIDDPAIGDYVIVHAGFAINKVDENEALEALKVLREIAESI